MRYIAHLVKCIYCGKTFDRDKVPFTAVTTRRYAHQSCAEAENNKQKQEVDDKLKLNDYIIKLFNLDYVTPRIQKQLQKYIENYHYTYSGIHKALTYWFEIKNNPIESAKESIGIVPYIYQDAYNYYYALWLAQEANKGKQISDFIPQVKVIEISPPERKVKKRKLFTFLDIEEEKEGE